MSIKILMPALSPTMVEGNLAKWLVKVGDIVKAGDVIAEIETDKATMEIESVDEGKVIELLFSNGDQKIPVNTPIAIISNSKINEEENESIEITEANIKEKIIKKSKNQINYEKSEENFRDKKNNNNHYERSN